MYEPQLSRLITQAISRIHSEMGRATPFMAQQVSRWLEHLSGTHRPDDYFKHPLAFPVLLLPWWLEKSCGQAQDLSLQSDLIYSTINGYYYIRLIDNLMDGHATVELSLLPALGFFHTQFQAAYQPHFEAGHPFWHFFITTWLYSAEVVMKDASLTGIDESQFKQISAQKVCAAKIPLAAVCYRHNRSDLIEPWSRLVDGLGCWHQFLNDLLGWHRDDTRQTCTYFLSEAARRRNADEPVAGWVAREGFAWAIEKLQTWMLDLQALAGKLHNPALLAYLAQREAMLLRQQEDITEGLRNMAKIIAVRQ